MPVPTTLATAEPLMEPIRPEATTADRAGPLLILPVREMAILLMKSEQPDASRKAPNMTNIKITLTAVLFRKELPTLGKLTAPFLLYPALLGGSLALAAPLPFTAGARWWPVALGCLLFYISDMLVAKNQLSRWPDKWQKPIMALYWAALYLISTGAWPR